jgi:hypothetical protein
LGCAGLAGGLFGRLMFYYGKQSQSSRRSLHKLTNF